MVIGERIKQARIKKGMSQEDLGKLLDVSKVSICGYELGIRIPSLENMMKLVEHLNLSPNYLLGYDVSIVNEEEEPYNFKIAKEDVTIIREIKKHPSLYNKLIKEPKRTLEMIDRTIIN